MCELYRSFWVNVVLVNICTLRYRSAYFSLLSTHFTMMMDYISGKWYSGFWTGFFWFMMETSGGLL